MMKRMLLSAALVGLTLPVAASQAPTWLLQVTGVNASLRGVSAWSESVVWASGSGSVVLRSTNGGSSWMRLPPPNAAQPDERLDYRDVDVVGDTTAYVLSIGAGPQSRIYKTTDAGQTWTLQFTNDNPKAFFDAMAFWDDERGLEISDSVNGEFVVIVTEDGGTTWTRIPPERFPPALPNEGAFAASGTNVAVHGTDHVWIATGAAKVSRVLRSSDRGKTWQVADTPLAAGPSAGAYSIAFRDARHGIVVGGDYTKEREAAANAAVTTDGGATWTPVTGLRGLRSVVAPVPGTATTWLAVGPSGAELSRDDGRTWQPIDGPGFHTFSFAPGVPVGWAAGSAGRVARLDLR